MAITTCNHVEVVSKNKYEYKRPSTSAQNVEEATSATPSGIKKATENTNEAEESSSSEEIESSSDSDSLGVLADKSAEQPAKPLDLTPKYFGDLLKYRSTVKW